MSWLPVPTDPGGALRGFLASLITGGASQPTRQSAGRLKGGKTYGGTVTPPTSSPPAATPPAPSGSGSYSSTTTTSDAVAPLPPPPPSPEDWLTSYLPAQVQKNQVDLDLEQSLADMLFQRNQYEQQNTTTLNDIDRQAPMMYEDVAEQFAGRGLLNSSLYSNADDRAFQGVQNQRTTLQQALSDYISNYDRSRQQQQQQAEQQKRGIEAEALQRYQQLYGQFA